jgi:hypothetical protein
MPDVGQRRQWALVVMARKRDAETLEANVMRHSLDHVALNSRLLRWILRRYFVHTDLSVFGEQDVALNLRNQ